MKYRRNFVAPAALLLGLSLTGCDDGGDDRTEQITAGMTRTALMSVIQGGEGGGPAGDPSANIWRTSQYLVEGKMIEVLWYSRSNERRTATDTVPVDRVFPVVIVNDTVIGAGAKVFDSVAKATSIPRTKF